MYTKGPQLGDQLDSEKRYAATLGERSLSINGGAP
jgi:hypothetical protein